MANPTCMGPPQEWYDRLCQLFEAAKEQAKQVLTTVYSPSKVPQIATLTHEDAFLGMEYLLVGGYNNGRVKGWDNSVSRTTTMLTSENSGVTLDSAEQQVVGDYTTNYIATLVKLVDAKFNIHLSKSDIARLQKSFDERAATRLMTTHLYTACGGHEAKEPEILLEDYVSILANFVPSAPIIAAIADPMTQDEAVHKFSADLNPRFWAGQAYTVLNALVVNTQARLGGRKLTNAEIKDVAEKLREPLYSMPTVDGSQMDVLNDSVPFENRDLLTQMVEIASSYCDVSWKIRDMGKAVAGIRENINY